MQSRSLYDLQQIDLQFASAVKELEEVRSRLSDESPILSAREKLEDLTSQLKEITVRRRAVDKTVAELQERIEDLESKLYGGSIKNPREMSAVEEERQFTVKQQQDEEEKLLEIMVDLEELESGHASAKAELEGLEEARPSEKVELQKSEQRLEADIARFQDDRNEVVPVVDPELIGLYDSLRQTKNGQAVAKVERGMCQACRLTLPQSELQRARSATRIAQCNSCHRILYVG